jgi:biopolymer transport protein TolR
MRRRQGKTVRQDLNITNLVDVTFTILVVFMITAPLMSQGIKVSLPKTQAPTIENQKLIRVTVDDKKQIFIDDVSVRHREFASVLRAKWDGNAPVVLNGDESVPYGFMIQLIARAQEVGVDKIGFLTSPPPRNR